MEEINHPSKCSGLNGVISENDDPMEKEGNKMHVASAMSKKALKNQSALHQAESVMKRNLPKYSES